MLVKQKKLWLLLPVFLAFTSIVSFSLSSTAYADYTVPAGQNCEDGSAPQGPTRNCSEQTRGSNGEQPQPEPQEGVSGNVQTNNSDDSITCAIEKIGWILCPLIESAGRVGDQAFQYLAKNFLETEPELVATNSGTYIAWELGRNIANILFIIAFLIIIYSQVTGAGINNYGIKRMLPRLILAALAVNLSYFICQGMVDLTNIIGYEVQNAMVNIAKQVTDSVIMPPQTSLDIQTSNGALGKIAAAAMGLTIVWALLPVLTLGISTVVITCLIIIIILLLRKAFIVLLVVIAPIAFVAYLLPNTEKLFSKWLNMFWQLLLVFPIIGLLFGAGQLASAIILVAGTNGETAGVYQDGGGVCLTPATYGGGEASTAPCPTGEGGIQATNATPLSLGLVAAGIAVAPLLAVWAVLKGALSAAGAIGGKIAGAVQSTGGGLGNRAKKGEDALRGRAGENMKGAWQRMQARGIGEDGNPTSLAGRYSMSRARRKKRLDLSSGDLERAQQQALNEQLANPRTAAELTSGLSAAGAARATQGAMAAQDKLLEEQTHAAGLVARDQTDRELSATIDGLLSGELNVNDPTVAAAIDQFGKRQNFHELERIMNHLARPENAGSSHASRTLSSALQQNATGMFSGGQIASIASGQNRANYMDTVSANLANGSMTPEKLAGINSSIANEVSHVLATSDPTGAAAATMSTASSAVMGDAILNKKISGIQNNLTAIASRANTAQSITARRGW